MERDFLECGGGVLHCTPLFWGLVLGGAKYVPPPHAPLHVHECPGARAFGTGGSKGLRH